MGALGTSVGVAAGAGLGWVAAQAVRRIEGRAGVVASGVGLVGAALIYPAARRELGPGVALEAAVLAGASALTAAAAKADSGTGRRLVAAGWASHALFDFLQGASDDSRLPGWYPSVCAGYDVAYAARLAS